MPTITASGRQVRSRFGGVYGETVNDDDAFENEDVEPPRHYPSRPRRGSRGAPSAHHSYGRTTEYDSAEESENDEGDDVSERDYGDDEGDGDHVPAESEAGDDGEEASGAEGGIFGSDDEEVINGDKKSLVLKLKVAGTDAGVDTKTVLPSNETGPRSNGDESQNGNHEISKMHKVIENDAQNNGVHASNQEVEAVVGDRTGASSTNDKQQGEATAIAPVSTDVQMTGI